jgi:hypothetical protein
MILHYGILPYKVFYPGATAATFSKLRTNENKNNQTSTLVWYNLLLQGPPPGITAEPREAVIPHKLHTQTQTQTHNHPHTIKG